MKALHTCLVGGKYPPVSTLASLALHFLLLVGYQPTSGVLATTDPGIPGDRPSQFKGVKLQRRQLPMGGSL